jgi:pilus assembly protein CpaB
MRRGRILIFVVLIILIGLVVGLFALQQFLRLRPAQSPANVDIYVAGQNIPQGGAITEAVLTTISIPQDKVISVMFTRDELAQLTTNKIARFPLDQGTVITEAMVVDKSIAVTVEGPQWAALVPPGMTAVSIPSTRLGLSGYSVADGAHVNVTGCFLFVDVDPAFQSLLPNHLSVITGTGILPDTLPVLSLGATGAAAEGAPVQGRLELDPSLQQPFYLTPSESARPRVACQLLLQDVVVLRVGNFPVANSAQVAEQPANQNQQQQQASPAGPDIVTLIVSPQDATTLTYLSYTNAQIQLSLRNPTDQSRQATEAATLQFLLSQYNIPVPAKLPYALEPRLDALVAPVLQNDAAPTAQ